MNYTDEQIEAYITGIFNGTITEYALPKSLYKAIAEYFIRGLNTGFGNDITFAKDLELLSELRESLYMFSAAKTYQETKAISSLLVDENGVVRSYSKFKELAKQTYTTWNDDWGRSEYNTSLATGQMSVKWNTIEQQKDLFTMLRYSAVGGEETCEICGRLDDMIAPATSKVWDKIYPPNHFNCMCTVLQEYDAKSTEGYRKLVNESVANMQDTFIRNASKDGSVFGKDHPYFDVPKKDKEYAKNNFNLPIPKNV